MENLFGFWTGQKNCYEVKQTGPKIVYYSVGAVAPIGNRPPNRAWIMNREEFKMDRNANQGSTAVAGANPHGVIDDDNFIVADDLPVPPVVRRRVGRTAGPTDDVILQINELKPGQSIGIPLVVTEEDMVAAEAKVDQNPNVPVEELALRIISGRVSSKISAAKNRGTIGFGTTTRRFAPNTARFNETENHVLRVWRDRD